LLLLINEPFLDAVSTAQLGKIWTQYSILDFAEADEAFEYFINVLVYINLSFFALITIYAIRQVLG